MKYSYLSFKSLAEAGRLAIARAPLGSVDPRVSAELVTRLERTAVKDQVDILGFDDSFHAAGVGKSCVVTDGAEVWMCVGKGRAASTDIPSTSNMVFASDGYTWVKVFDAPIGRVQGPTKSYDIAPKFGVTHYAGVNAPQDHLVKIWPQHHQFTARRDPDGIYGVFHGWPGITSAKRLYAVTESPTYNTTRLPILEPVVVGGAIQSVNIVDPGQDLVGIATNHVFGDGSGATFDVTIAAGSVTSVDVVTVGSGYTWCDVVVCSEGGSVFPSASPYWNDLVDAKTVITAVLSTPDPCMLWLVALDEPIKTMTLQGNPSMVVIKPIGETNSVNTEVNITITSEV